MNKQQYKAYRRNQRICYNYDYGEYGNDAQTKYFNLIPYVSEPLRRGVTDLNQCFNGWKNSGSFPDYRTNVRDQMKFRYSGG